MAIKVTPKAETSRMREIWEWTTWKMFGISKNIPDTELALQLANSEWNNKGTARKNTPQLMLNAHLIWIISQKLTACGLHVLWKAKEPPGAPQAAAGAPWGRATLPEIVKWQQHSTNEINRTQEKDEDLWYSTEIWFNSRNKSGVEHNRQDRRGHGHTTHMGGKQSIITVTDQDLHSQRFSRTQSSWAWLRRQDYSSSRQSNRLLPSCPWVHQNKPYRWKKFSSQ